MIKHIVENSQSIKSIAFSENLQILLVEFVTGATYIYVDVDPSLMKDFINAESKGQFFAKYIRDNYEFEKIDEM